MGFGLLWNITLVLSPVIIFGTLAHFVSRLNKNSPNIWSEALGCNWKSTFIPLFSRHYLIVPRMPAPYSECIDTDNRKHMSENEIYGKYLDDNMEYTLSQCWDMCLQVKVILFPRGCTIQESIGTEGISPCIQLLGQALDYTAHHKQAAPFTTRGYALQHTPQPQAL